jgi:hypothetical protein
MPPKAPKKNGFHALGTKLKQALTPAPKRALELPYPKSLLKAAEVRAGYTAIYIIAPRDTGWPISFGVTSDPAATYWAFQRGYWSEHCLHELQWTAGKPVADRLKRAMQALMASKKKGFFGSWYDATVDEAKIALIAAARQEGIALFDDVDKQRKLHRIALKAWEAKVGVETIPIEAPTAPRPSAKVIHLTPRKI